MKIAVFAYTRRGCATARKIMACFPEYEIKAYTIKRFEETGFLLIEKPSEQFYGELFRLTDAMIFVSSCGIAVREIAPHIKDKCTDPAVICIDESGKYVIPLLAGHIGGANRIAREIAKLIYAVPVITTATDVNCKFSVDAWAAQQDFVIDDMSLAKAVSATILEKNIPLTSGLEICGEYPNGVEYAETGELGIYIGWKKKFPYERTLRIIPRLLHLGIGCRKGITASAVENAISSVLNRYNIDRRAIKTAASIDIKSEENGLLEYCGKNGLQIRFYTADELRSLKGDFTASEFVESITGVDNVCERAALYGAKKLIVKKTAVNGVTVALAAEDTEVSFG